MFASTRCSRNGPVPTLACLTAPPHGSFPTSMLPLLFLLLAGDTTGYWQQQVAYQIAAALDEPSAGPRRVGAVDLLGGGWDWGARPSTLPRRPGREGRRCDSAQWYAEAVVHAR